MYVFMWMLVTTYESGHMVRGDQLDQDEQDHLLSGGYDPAVHSVWKYTTTSDAANYGFGGQQEVTLCDSTGDYSGAYIIVAGGLGGSTKSQPGRELDTVNIIMHARTLKVASYSSPKNLYVYISYR